MTSQHKLTTTSALTPPAASFIPSPQQQAYFDWIVNGSGSAIVRAVAGAGKTSTLIEGLRLMSGSIYFGAYNKAIAKEIAEKAEAKGVMRQGLFVGTLHSAGFSAWRRVAPKVRVDENKTRGIMDAEQVPEYQRQFVQKMVSLAKQLLLPLDPSGINAWLDAVSHYGADNELPDDDGGEVHAACEVAQRIHRLGRKACHQIIDFDDMIYAPLTHCARFYQNDWVLIDEAQDTNPARRMLCQRMLKPNGRLVAVGDDRQAIYGFTGASSNALELISNEHDCTWLPLTVTYRCPKAVVKYAQQWVSHIEAHESAPEGTVREVLPRPEAVASNAPWFAFDTPAATDAVLCRFTRPLISTAYGMLKVGIACRVEGRDIGNGLINLARRWKVRTLDALDTRLETYLKREVAKARAKKSEAAEQSVTDRVGTLRIFIERCREKGNNTIECVVAEIQALFADDVKGVTTLATIHKSKGREWSRVFWLQGRVTRELQPWEEVQEDNLAYVATTRAQDTLVLVPQ